MSPGSQSTLSPAQERAALALAQAMLPVGRRLPGADARTVGKAATFVGGLAPGGERGFGTLVQTLDRAAILRTARPFHRLSPQRQQRLIETWERDPVLRWPLFALSFLLKSSHFDDPAIYQSLGCVYDKGGPAEPVRWMQQVTRGEDWDDGAEIECDVVVIGTGAGGAVVGGELAERGYAVVFLEEGEFHRRDAFTGSAKSAHERFYRGKGGLVTLGNNVMPVFVGRLVGGSTAINTGTSFRTPPWILDQWCEKLATSEFEPARMEPHFERAERELRVTPNEMKYIGAIGQIVARGCDKLGWSHFPVPRNAPDCDGQGVCDFGCPTDARRSTNISYIPPALERGAMLFTGMQARRVRIENGRAVGVTAKSVRGGKTLWVRSRAVVVSCGAVPTPIFLSQQGLCAESGQLGRNLTIHPASGASALFDEPVEGYNHIPQGYGCDEFHREGILLLGAQASINVGSLLFTMNGRPLMDVMDRFDQVASFGAMIEDAAPNGRVRAGPGGWPIITYTLQPEDVRRLHQGVLRVMEIFEAAGADEFYPLNLKVPRIKGKAEFERFRKHEPKPWEFLCSSFHPLGTCRMGRDPKSSVVSLDHEAHEVPGLFVVDGSTVPGAPAVNPQLTIMAMATRAAGKLAERLG